MSGRSFLTRARDVLRLRLVSSLGNPAPSPEAAAVLRGQAGIPREAAESLSRRGALAVLTYPILVVVVALITPGASRRLALSLPCGLLVALLAGADDVSLRPPLRRR